MTRTLSLIRPLCRLVGKRQRDRDMGARQWKLYDVVPGGGGRTTWEAGDVLTMSAEEFDEAVGDALDHVPADLLALMDNVVFLVEDEPPPDDPELLGIYDGTPLTERHDGWAAGALPDRITIFRGPTLRMCRTRQDILDEVAITVVHEIAHHFGIDDAKLHELGWD